MTPAEAAYYLNVPNMIMVNCQGIPVPFSHDAEKYMITFTPCKKVLWSVDGSIGGRLGFEAEYVLDLSRRYPNLCGAFMDDLSVVIVISPNLSGPKKLRISLRVSENSWTKPTRSWSCMLYTIPTKSIPAILNCSNPLMV